MRILLITLVSFVFFFGCSKDVNYVTVADRVIARTAKQICEEENMSFVGSGGAMSDGIKWVSLRFSARREVDIKEARRLCVKCVEKVTEALNCTPSLTPYFYQFPFQPIDVDISIMFLNQNGFFIIYDPISTGGGGVSLVGQVGGKVYYSSFSRKDNILEDLYEESYKKALEALKQ